ncbi:hypothetical protein [Tenacibaculum sp. Ill]|uniref:hypothetical protein n=1 Tax=Tenacibaculum sp. Ill TaxID=3445935 RepID=UPI003F78FFC7
MKKIIILSIFLFSFSLFSQKENYTLSNSKSSHEKKAKPYQVLYSSPSLKYRIVKKNGTTNKITFLAKGNGRLPQLELLNTSGFLFNEKRKTGFVDIQYPFECKLSCSVNFTENGFNSLPSAINGFKIKINEPGEWEVIFIN